MDLIYPPSQAQLGREKDTLVGADGAPNCRWTWSNRTLRFVKLEYPICPISSWSFQLLFVSSANKDVLAGANSAPDYHRALRFALFRVGAFDSCSFRV
jgi:hypothetical protein